MVLVALFFFAFFNFTLTTRCYNLGNPRFLFGRTGGALDVRPAVDAGRNAGHGLYPE